MIGQLEGGVAPPHCIIFPFSTLFRSHAGQEAKGRDEIDRIVKEAAAAGATVVVASHEIERAQQLATRTVSLIAGQVRESQ